MNAGAGPDLRGDSEITRKVYLGVGCLTLVRLIWHLFEPIGMVGDETYYWEWGRRLDWGYFSKPPMIGWLYGILGMTFGNHTFVFKTAATLFTSAGLLGLFHGTRIAVGARIAAWAVLLAAASPANLMLASILTIDAPLLFFWAVGFALTARLIFDANPPKASTWALFAMVWGLGYLSKQMMMVQPVLVLLAALWCRPDLLRKAGFYVAVAASYLFLLPPLLWNARNDWATFRHTAHHFSSATNPIWERAGEFLGGMLGGIFTPVAGVLLVIATVACLRRPMVLSKAERFFFVFGPLGLIAISFLLFRQKLNLNWPAVFFLASYAFLAAVWLQRFPGRIVWMKAAVVVAAVLSIATMAILPLRAQLQLAKSATRLDHGYREGAEAVQRVIDTLEPGSYSGILLVGRRFDVSQLAFHLSGNPIIHHFTIGERVESQYDVWPGPELEKSYLLIRVRNTDGSSPPDPTDALPGYVRRCFDRDDIQAMPESQVAVPLIGRVHSYDVFLTGPLRQWNAQGPYRSEVAEP